MTIREAFSAYRMDVIAFRNQSRKTEENHLIVQRNLVAFFGDRSIESLSFDDVRNWKLDLDKGRSPETVRNYIIKLRVVLGYLRQRGFDVLKPDLVPVPKRTDKVPVFITKEQVALLISCTNKVRNKAMISILYSSGIRVNELCSLNIDSISNSSFTIVGKGGKARLCFIDKRTEGYLKTYLGGRKDNNQALFISDFNGLRMTPGNVQEVFKYARTKARLPNVHPHTMRHSFATNLLRSNMNIRYVQELLGHSSLETTQMYLHVVNEDLKEQYRLHHSV